MRLIIRFHYRRFSKDLKHSIGTS